MPFEASEYYVDGKVHKLSQRNFALGTGLMSDTDFGYQGLVGVDYFVTRNFSVGLEYRKLKVDADLGPTIPGGKFDAGGDFAFVTFRGHF